jgi:hypothetical protein
MHKFWALFNRSLRFKSVLAPLGFNSSNAGSPWRLSVASTNRGTQNWRAFVGATFVACSFIAHEDKITSCQRASDAERIEQLMQRVEALENSASGSTSRTSNVDVVLGAQWGLYIYLSDGTYLHDSIFQETKEKENWWTF